MSGVRFMQEKKFISKYDSCNREKVRNFLENYELYFDEAIEFTIAYFADGEIIATGSYDDQVIKCLCVADEYRGYGLTSAIVSELIAEQYSNGITHLFVYTTPKNRSVFDAFHFHEIIEIPNKVLVMENKKDGLKKYITRLKKNSIKGQKAAALVMNCNPFTNGHRFLIEKAAKENEHVYLFIVMENRSEFSAEQRVELVKTGTQDLENVSVCEGKDYIISKATFPTYFFKKQEDVVAIHAELDATIFAKLIAPRLNITRRYVGEEPLCLVTNQYNQVLANILPQFGIEVKVIPRLKEADEPISASKVRSLLAQKDYDGVTRLVPKHSVDQLIDFWKQNQSSNV